MGDSVGRGVQVTIGLSIDGNPHVAEKAYLPTTSV